MVQHFGKLNDSCHVPSYPFVQRNCNRYYFENVLKNSLNKPACKTYLQMQLFIQLLYINVRTTAVEFILTFFSICPSQDSLHSLLKINFFFEKKFFFLLKSTYAMSFGLFSIIWVETATTTKAKHTKSWTRCILF